MKCATVDLLKHAAKTLEAEANAVGDNPLVFSDTWAVLSGGNLHAKPGAFAADIIAMVVCDIRALVERRMAMLVDSAISGVPAFLTPNLWPALRLHDAASDSSRPRQ